MGSDAGVHFFSVVVMGLLGRRNRGLREALKKILWHGTLCCRLSDQLQATRSCVMVLLEAGLAAEISHLNWSLLVAPIRHRVGQFFTPIQ